MKKKKNGTRSIILSALLFLVLFAVTYYILYKKFEINTIVSILKGVNINYLYFALSMVFIYLFCYGLFAKTLLKIRGCNVSLTKGFVYACIDFYFCGITPSASGGQPMVIYYMNKDGIPASAGTFSTFVHTCVYKVVLLVFNLIALIFFAPTWYNAGPLFIVLWFLGFFVTSFVITVGLLSMFKRDLTYNFCKWIIRIGAKLHIVKNPEKRLESFNNSLDDYQQAAKDLKGRTLLIVRLFAIVFVQRTALFSVAFIVYRALGNTGYGFMYFLAVQVFIALAVDSLPLPGGIGANEAAIIMMYTSTFGEDQAASAMLLIRFFNCYVALIISFFVFSVNYFSHWFKTKRKD